MLRQSQLQFKSDDYPASYQNNYHENYQENPIYNNPIIEGYFPKENLKKRWQSDKSTQL